MVEESIKEEPKSKKSKSIVKKYVYMMGKKGGFLVEVRQNLEDDKRYLKINKWWSGSKKDSYLVINQERHWKELKRFVDHDFSKFLGWSGYELDKLPDSSGYVSKDDYERAIRKKDKEIQHQAKELDIMQEDLNQIRKTAKKRLMDARKTKIPQYKKELEKLQKLMNESKKERELHEFLRNNPWMFGPQYVVAKSEKRIGFRSRADFLLETFDAYNDIVELKKSKKVNIFTRDRLSGVTKDAISQMIGYLNKCDQLYSDNRIIFGHDILKPKGIIIIGRKGDKNMIENLRIHNFYLHNIEIITYDELYERAKKSIEMFEVNK